MSTSVAMVEVGEEESTFAFVVLIKAAAVVGVEEEA